jgi:Raf kinase inhibitor-like YbhB/YbcL family protein
MSPPNPVAAFTLESTTVAPGKPLPSAHVLNGFGCTGKNRSPELAWYNPPDGTRSFAVTVYDPDAPTGSGWWHWVVFDIPSAINHLPEDAGSGYGIPVEAVQSRTDFGTTGYGGACPPPGAPHRYIFTVYALKLDHLNLTPEASAALVGFTIGANSLGKASLTAFYER